MKPRIALTIVALALVALLSSTLQAQEKLLFRVGIPFEFIAGGVHLSAGQYLAFHETPTILKLVREDGRGSAWIAVKPSPAMADKNTNEIVFNRYGETYFLASVQTGHDQQVHECFRCRAEQTLAAQHRTDVKTVAIAAK